MIDNEFLVTAKHCFESRKARKQFIASEKEARKGFKVLGQGRSYHGCGKYHWHWRSWDVYVQYEDNKNTFSELSILKIEVIKEETFYAEADRTKWVEEHPEANIIKMVDWPKRCHDGHIYKVKYAVAA